MHEHSLHSYNVCFLTEESGASEGADSDERQRAQPHGLALDVRVARPNARARKHCNAMQCN
jgi:hypothetical protein